MGTDETPNGNGRQLAHERLATGAWAGWARACAVHPRRVLLSWLGIVVVLIALVATVGGGLRDEFEIPGSDTQRATDLIEQEFATEQGGVLNVVFAAPEGERLDTDERKAAIEGGHARVCGRDEFKPTEDTAGLDERRRPVRARRRSPTSGRIAYAEAQFDRVIYDEDRESVVAVQDAVREAVEPRRRDRRVQRRRRVPADRAGHVRAARAARGADRAADRLPHVRRGVHPDRARDRRVADGVLPALHPRRPHRHQHDHADPRDDDRARRGHRLLAVHRHALQTARSTRGCRRATPPRRPGRPPAARCSSPA